MKPIQHIDELAGEVVSGRVTRTDSACGNFAVLNYTPECQYGRLWNDLNRQARGLIFDCGTGEVVARPFPKFFNLGEEEGDYERIAALGEPCLVEDKLDGSLGIVFWDDHAKQLRVSTRGTCNSEQAQWATEYLQRMHSRGHAALFREMTAEGWTPLVEIIYPDNRIVIDYEGAEGLPLLGAVSIAYGEIMDSKARDDLAEDLGVPVPRNYNELGLQGAIDSSKEIPWSREGYVLHWVDTKAFGGRYMLKVKGEEYRRVHRFIQGMGDRAILQQLRDGDDPLRDTDGFPETLLAPIRERVALFTEAHADIITEASMSAARAIAEGMDRKAAAQWARKRSEHTGLVLPCFFALFDGREDKARSAAWKYVQG